MKKSLIISTISAAVILSSIVYASDIDLKSMSDEEITQLYSDVEQELVDRNINKSSDLLPGTYVGGVDIPVGGYDISIESPDGFFTMELIGINKNTPNYYNCENLSPNDTGSFHVSIQDGYTLVTSGRSATITINNGLNFQ